jgi:hypothetical protein
MSKADDQATQFAPRESVPPPLVTGNRVWHYALAILLAMILTFLGLEELGPTGLVGGFSSVSTEKILGDYGPTDDQISRQRVRREDAEREQERDNR